MRRVPIIRTAQEMHGVDGPLRYRLAQARHLKDRRIRGEDVRAFEVLTPVIARIDWNRWIIDCTNCGTGNATHPLWGIACCFYCGAVHKTITFPGPLLRARIEQALLARAAERRRNWIPQRETAADLEAQNTTLPLSDPDPQPLSPEAE